MSAARVRAKCSKRLGGKIRGLAALFFVSAAPAYAQEAFSTAEAAHRAGIDGQQTYDENLRCTDSTAQRLGQLQHDATESLDELKSTAGACQQAMTEFGQGRFCAHCLRSSSEIFAQLRITLEQHVSNPRSQPPPASSVDVERKSRQCSQELARSAQSVTQLWSSTQEAVSQWRTCEAARVAAWVPTRTAQAWDAYLTVRERLGALREGATRREELRKVRVELAGPAAPFPAEQVKSPKAAPRTEAAGVSAERRAGVNSARSEWEASVGNLATGLGGQAEQNFGEAQAFAFSNAMIERLKLPEMTAGAQGGSWRPVHDDAPTPETLDSEIRRVWEHTQQRHAHHKRAVLSVPLADSDPSPVAFCLAAIPPAHAAPVDDALAAALQDESLPPMFDAKKRDQTDAAVHRYWRLASAVPVGAPAVRRALRSVHAHRLSLLLNELDPSTEVAP